MRLTFALFLFVLGLIGLVSSATLQNVPGKRGVHLPGMADLLENFQKKLDQALDEVIGLTKEQRKELVDEFKTGIKEFPHIKEWESLKPSQLLKYIKDITDFTMDLVKSLNEKAKELAEQNEVTREDKIDIRAIRLPGMADLLEHLKKKFDHALEKVTGLTKEQRQELYAEFKAGIKEFPHVNGWETLKPSQLPQYLKEIKEFAADLVKSLNEKAKKLAEQNEVSGANKIDIRDVQIPGTADLLRYLKEEFGCIVKACFFKSIRLTKEQRQELYAEFKARIKEFPHVNGWETLKPSQLPQYLKKIKEFVADLVKSLKEKAKKLAEQNEVTGEDKIDIRAVQLPAFVEKIIDGLVSTFASLIDRIEQLSEDQKESLVNEFEVEIRAVPLPQMSGWQWINPLAWTKYSLELTEHSVELTKRLVRKAQTYIEGETGIELPDLTELIAKRDLEIPVFIKEIQEKMTRTFKNFIQSVTGLTHENQLELVDEFKAGLSRLPLPNMEGVNILNPFKWGEYIVELTKYNVELTKTLYQKAKDLIENKERVAREEQKELPAFVEKIIDGLVSTFASLIDRIEQLSEDQKESLINEFEVEIRAVPLPQMSGWQWINPLAWTKYSLELTEHSVELTKRLVRKAQTYIEGETGIELPDLTELIAKRDLKIPEAFVDNQLEKVQEREEDSAVSSLVKNILNRIHETFRAALDTVGLTEEKRDKIVAEFNKFIENFPRLSKKDAFNPMKLLEYGQRLIAYGQNAIVAFLDKAKESMTS